MRRQVATKQLNKSFNYLRRKSGLDLKPLKKGEIGVGKLGDVSFYLFERFFKMNVGRDRFFVSSGKRT